MRVTLGRCLPLSVLVPHIFNASLHPSTISTYLQSFFSGVSTSLSTFARRRTPERHASGISHLVSRYPRARCFKHVLSRSVSLFSLSLRQGRLRDPRSISSTLHFVRSGYGKARTVPRLHRQGSGQGEHGVLYTCATRLRASSTSSSFIDFDP